MHDEKYKKGKVLPSGRERTVLFVCLLFLFGITSFADMPASTGFRDFISLF